MTRAPPDQPLRPFLRTPSWSIGGVDAMCPRQAPGDAQAWADPALPEAAPPPASRPVGRPRLGMTPLVPLAEVDRLGTAASTPENFEWTARGLPARGSERTRGREPSRI